MGVIRLNVGGTTFTTLESTLQAVPGTKLCRLNTASSEFDSSIESYFFDRNSRIFESILDFYRSGELHFPRDICGAIIKRELEFWEIPLTTISDCCFANVCDYDETMKNMTSLRSTFEDRGMQFSDKDLQNSNFNKYRDIIWRFINNPQSSVFALIYKVAYFLFLVTPILTFILGTHQSFREDVQTPVYNFTYGNRTWEFTLRQAIYLHTGNHKLAMLATTASFDGISYTNYVCLAFYVIEVLTRIVCCPRKLQLLKNPLLYIDSVLLIACFISLGIEVNNTYMENAELYNVCKALLVLRTLRLIHMSRHVGGLRVLGLAILGSLKELLLLLLFFLTVAIFFAAALYLAEFYTSNTFADMPITIWWSIVTMTTVGYGDFAPSTFAGYTIASVCAIVGVLVISMPIAIIVANFSGFNNLNRIMIQKQALSDNVEGNNNQRPVVHKSNKIGCSEA